MAEIKQDSEALKKIAEEIRDLGRRFNTERDAFFNAVKAEIGEDETHKTWYGPNAKKFIDEFEKAGLEFDKAYANIMSMADNLDEQANAWQSFESDHEVGEA